MQAGIAALFQIAGRSTRTAHAGDFGFAVGPRINAAGRLTDMTIASSACSRTTPIVHWNWPHASRNSS